MRVIFFGFNDPRVHARGVEYVILTQAAACTRGYYLFLGPRREVFRWRGMVCISVAKSWRWPLALNGLVCALRRRLGPVVIHAHNYLMALALWCAPVHVFTVHDGLQYLKAAMGRPSRLFGWIERRVYAKARVVHFISAYSRAMAQPVPAQVRAVEIANTCPRELLEVDEPGMGACAPDESARRYALIVRSVEERAGLDLVLDLAERLRAEERADLCFLIAGKGPLLESMRSKTVDRGLAGQVEFLGYVSDERLAALYRGAHFVLVPALYGEGFGLPVVEGYFFGKTVIASNVCAIPEVIQSRAFLFDNDPDSIHESAVAVDTGRLVVSPAQARAFYEQHFGLARYRAAFEALYKEVVV